MSFMNGVSSDDRQIISSLGMHCSDLIQKGVSNVLYGNLNIASHLLRRKPI